MYRGTQDLSKNVVLDPKYYTNAHISRGDIIYYDTSENDQKLGFDISTVIGFYSNAHWGGLDFKMTG